jgi:signal transduction histidine kinase
MSIGPVEIPRKWRPRLGIITAATLASVLALPLGGLAILWGLRGRPVELTWTETVALTALILPVTGLIGFVFHRTLTRPVQDLIARADALGRGDVHSLTPLPHHGTAELAELSRSFEDMAARLAARSAYLSSFAAHVSHELKSPLTAIHGAAELLHDALEPGEPAMDGTMQRRFLNNIIADTDRLTRLLDDLRDLARAETLPKADTCALSPLLDELRMAMPGLPLVGEGALDTQLALSPDALRLILGHLAENAVQNGARRLHLNAQPTDTRLNLSVSDDGSGIDPRFERQIFESFFTTRRPQGGTGMGLAIVRATLGAYRGTIALAETGPLPGATFILDLPRDLPRAR